MIRQTGVRANLLLETEKQHDDHNEAVLIFLLADAEFFEGDQTYEPGIAAGEVACKRSAN